jgi:putative redox protein
MNITLSRQNDAFHFKAQNEDGYAVDIDASPAVGGSGKGVRPMQLMLMSLGGCSGIDVVNILNKQKQYFSDLHILIDGEREEGAVPSLFEDIQIHFQFQGDVDPTKARRAAGLSIEKYCSAAATLSQSATISFRDSVNGVEVESR